MPLDVELAEIRDLLTSAGAGCPAEQLGLTFRARGATLGAGDEVVAVRSGSIAADRVVTDDALLLVRPVPGAAAGPRLLAVDVETTGLVIGQDRLVAVGWVPIDGDTVDLAGARRYVVQGEDPGGAADIHGLTRADLVAGLPLATVLQELHAALAGRVLLAHHAPFDVGFLKAGHREVGMRWPRVPIICTLTLQKRLLRGDGGPWPAGALRLWVARERFGMPVGRPHDALGDAVACAELYLGQVAELATRGPVTVRGLRLRLTRRSRWRRQLRRHLRHARRGVRRVVSASSR